MKSTTIRINRETHARLEALAGAEGKPIGLIVEQLIAEHEKHQFFQGLADDFQRLRENHPEWRDYQDELAGWDGVLLDGMAPGSEQRTK